MDTLSILTITDRLLDIINLVRNGKLQQDKRTDEALSQAYAALVRTQAYANRNGARNHDTEHKISELWYQASIPLRHIDNELANICNLKGGYWSNPKAWDELDTGEYDIALSNVEKKLRDLLNK